MIENLVSNVTFRKENKLYFMFFFWQTAAATADLLFFPDQPAAGEGRPLDASLGTADHREIAQLVLDRLPGPVRLDGVAFQVGRLAHRDSLTRIIKDFGQRLKKIEQNNTVSSSLK
jgi:hypothetical protein